MLLLSLNFKSVKKTRKLVYYTKKIVYFQSRLTIMLIMDFPSRLKNSILKKSFLILSVTSVLYIYTHLMVLTSARGLATYTTFGFGLFWFFTTLPLMKMQHFEI